MDMVAAVQITKGRQQPPSQFGSAGDEGDESGIGGVDPVDPRLLPFQQPLAEVEEARHAAGAVAGEDLLALVGRRVLALGASAAQAVNASRTKNAVVQYPSVEGVIQGCGGLLVQLLLPPFTVAPRDTHLESHGPALTGQEMAHRVTRRPTAELLG
jgi:hypothetical protein